MLKYLPAHSKRILEIGCAQGSFSQAAKEKFAAECWGVELDTRAAAEATKKLDRVIVGDVNKNIDQLPDDYFDCIVFNDVLEHMYDPYSALRDLSSKLNKNGVMVCSIPNVRYYKVLYQLIFQRQWRYQESGVLDKTHIRFFTWLSIQETLKALNFEILKMEGIKPCRKLKIKILGWLTFGWLSDIRSHQYACIIRPKARH